MANQQGAADAPTTFRELFGTIGDVYNGVYAPYLAEYRTEVVTTPEDLMARTITQVPADQVPAVFAYQDNNQIIRIVHHIHRVESPLGQPANPLTNLILGFTGEVQHNTAQVVQLPAAAFFSATGDIVVPTIPTMMALLAAAPDGMVGPLLLGDPDTVTVNTRRAVPVPHAYVPLFSFRTMTPREAWEQVGEQIIQDQRAADCAVLLNFLRVATVSIRPNRNQPVGPPATAHAHAFAAPLDGPLIDHVHRKLRNLLPALFFQALRNEGPLHLAQTAAILGQTVADGFNALRADRVLERETAATPKSFSEVFPANATAIRRLCHADNDDDRLPEFWIFLASVKGKKAAGLAAFINYVTIRSNTEGSSRVLPIVSTPLYTNIAAFELGAADLETITQGISPFLMCPVGYVKAKDTHTLTQKYLMLQGGGTSPQLSDIQQLVPSNDYSIPDNFHTLTDFIGAYSIVWDVLIGEYHPLAVVLQQHYKFWERGARTMIRAIPESHIRNVVIIGTLRYIQLAVLRYVNEIMYSDGPIAIPSFDYIETALQGRLFTAFPSLPSEYLRGSHGLPLPPVPTGPVPSPPTGTPPKGNHITAPNDERHKPFLDMFAAGTKSIQQLRSVVGQPKEKKGEGTLCLSFHLRGVCFDSCRRSSTHRKLEKIEIDNMQAFLQKHV